VQVSGEKLGYMSRNNCSGMKSGLLQPAAGSTAGQDGHLGGSVQESLAVAGQSLVRGAGWGQGSLQAAVGPAGSWLESLALCRLILEVVGVQDLPSSYL